MSVYGSVLILSNEVVLMEQIYSMRLRKMFFFLWTAVYPAPDIMDS